MNPASNAVLAEQQRIEVLGKITPQFAVILTPRALDFVAELQREFGARRKAILAAREARQAEFDMGQLPDFLPETRQIRESAWQVAAQPADLLVGPGIPISLVPIPADGDEAETEGRPALDALGEHDLE